MRNKKRSQFWESAGLNNYTFRQYYNRMVEVAISEFEYVNAPPSIDQRFMELALFSEGKAVWFYDEVMNYLCLRCTIGGKMTVYRIPKMRMAIADNGYRKSLNEKNSVIIYNNFLRTNSMLDVEMYARRLYNLDRTIDVNVNAQKTPILIKCSENQLMTMKNLYMKYEGNEPVIFADDNLNTDGIKVINTSAPYVADRLYDLRTKIWNEAMTYLGVDNIGNEKKERQITNEVNASLGAVKAYRNIRLEARREGCKEIVKLFPDLEGLDCRYRDDVADLANALREEVI